MSTSLQPQQPTQPPATLPSPQSSLPMPSQYYHNHLSPLPHVDKIEDILRISECFEMDQRIIKNTGNIIKVFQHFKANLYKAISFTKDEIDYFIHCLKFVDTLNLFMNPQTISTLRRYMGEIYDIAYMSPTLEYKELILKQIKYTEMTVIDLKKNLFKKLFFGEPKHLALEIEKNLEQVIKNGKFEQRLFKQLQNLFYVVQGRFDDAKKEELQHKMNEMKSLSIKYRKQQKFGSNSANIGSSGNASGNGGMIGGSGSIGNSSSGNYYDNDKDFKNYSNVSESLVDYSDNFYENSNEQRMGYYDDIANDYGYGSHHDNSRHFYSRHYQYGSRYHGRKYFESEGKEVEIPATTTLTTTAGGNETTPDTGNNANGDNGSMNNNKNESITNTNMNNDGIEVIQTNVISSNTNSHHNHHHHQNNSHFNKNTFQNNNNNAQNTTNTDYYSNRNNTHSQHHNKVIHSHSPNPHLPTNPLTTTTTSTAPAVPPSQSSYPTVAPSTVPPQQQAYTATPSNSTYSSSSRKKILTRKNKQRGITLVEVPLPENISGASPSTNEPSQQSHRKDSYTPSSNISNHYKNEGTAVPNKTITKTDDTEIITTVINTSKQHGKYGYHQGSGYKGSNYGKGQYYGYSERYYHGRGDSYYHGGYQGSAGNTGGDYYGKRGMQMQGKKYYGARPKLDFVEVEDIKPQEVEIKDEETNGGDSGHKDINHNENNVNNTEDNDVNKEQEKDDAIHEQQDKQRPQQPRDNTDNTNHIESDKYIADPPTTNTDTNAILSNTNTLNPPDSTANTANPTEINQLTITDKHSQESPLMDGNPPLTIPSLSFNASLPQSQTPLPKPSSEMDFQQTFLCPSSTEPEHEHEHEQVPNAPQDQDMPHTGATDRENPRDAPVFAT